jgi:hypothetical protein
MEKTTDESFDNIMVMLGEIEQKIQKKVKENECISHLSEKKNSHLHIMIETSLINKVEKEAKEKGMSIAEFIRSKLRESDQLDRIEWKIDKFTKNTNS